MKTKLLLGLVTGIFCVGMAGFSQAAPVTWTDWIWAENGVYWFADGYIGSTYVSYSGTISFAQLGTDPTETNYWTEPVSGSEPYTGSSVIDNAPTPREMLALSELPFTHTIWFSAPVLDPVMAIVSMGRDFQVSYDFDQSFSVLSSGDGYYGPGTYSLSSGDVLNGIGFNGVIQFSGLVSSISWTSTEAQHWHGFTLGAPVPEPATMLLFGTGLAGLVGSRLRRRKK